MNKLSKRILSLSKLALYQEYQTVYDTCCDHGKIGLCLLDQKLSMKELVFVDIVPQIISDLKASITDIPSAYASLKTQTLSIKNLQFSKEDLVIIAGVGCDLILGALSTHQQKGVQPKHYLLSSHTKHLECRKALKEMGLKLVSEILIEEAGIFYDHLLVSYEEGKEIFPINRTGEDKVLSRYYEHHAHILKLKAKYANQEALNFLNIIKDLTIL